AHGDPSNQTGHDSRFSNPNAISKHPDCDDNSCVFRDERLGRRPRVGSSSKWLDEFQNSFEWGGAGVSRRSRVAYSYRVSLSRRPVEGRSKHPSQKLTATPPRRRFAVAFAVASSFGSIVPWACSNATSSFQSAPKGVSPTTERSCATEKAS